MMCSALYCIIKHFLEKSKKMRNNLTSGLQVSLVGRKKLSDKFSFNGRALTNSYRLFGSQMLTGNLTF